MIVTKTMKWTLLANVLGTLCMVGAAVAQDVSWAPTGPLGARQRATLDLVFEDTQPQGAVYLPAIDGLAVVGPPSESTRVSIVNGQRSNSVTLSYPVRAEREGRIEIPTFDVRTTDGPYAVAAMTIEAGPTMLSQKGRRGGTPLNEAVSAQMLPSTKRPYAGEVFDVDVVVGVRNGRRGELEGPPQWLSPGIESEGWSKGQPAATADSSTVRLRTHAVAPKAGTIALAPAQQDVRIEGGRSRKWDDVFSMPGFAMPKFSIPNFSMPDLSGFFSDRDMTEVTVATDPVELQVRPLPQSAPAGFNGAVGDFQLESKIVPAAPKAGEPVTWTLTLKGTGNWGSVQLPARAVPGDMRTLQPKQQRHFKEGERFTGTLSEDLVLIPSHAGTLRLEPVRFVYFNPQTEHYETAVARPPALIVAPSAAPQPETSSAQPSSAPQPAVAPAPPAVAAAENALPRGPLSGTGAAWLPHSSRWVLGLSSIPFGLLATYWLLLAVRRARRTDPRRPQREALLQLHAAIAKARQAADAEQRRAALLAWQHGTAVVLDLPVAAPTAVHVRAARVDEPLCDTLDEWFELWAESERALYGRDATLNESWYEHASTLCARIRLPWRNPLRAFLPQNLLPVTATAGLLILCAVSAYAEPVDEYNQGNFAAAQQQLATQIATAPADWVARYNLGLTAAQLGDNSRALAETVAAFALRPSNDSVRWNLRAFAERVSGLDETVAHVAFAPGVAAIARVAAPATWQAMVVMACVVLCAGGGLALQRRYRQRSGVVHLGLLACGALAMLTALVALHQYGPLANPAVAVVARASALHSVPTDAGGGQQTPLAAGALVIMQKDFLGWVKVARHDGETGWLRRSDLVPLYRAPIPA